MQPVRWGILSTANIGLEKVIPAMMKSEACDIRAIASRDLAKAEAAANKLEVPKAYGSYQELLQDPDIEAVYNPLPNQLHVPVSIEAAEAGKHVLCEKPIALTAGETQKLITARDRTSRLILEAFMVRHHPQWQQARKIARSGKLGDIKLIQSTFSFFNTDPLNIRNKKETGGGALYDIGVYPIVAARYFFGGEPQRVLGVMKRDPSFGIDILTSGILEYSDAMAVFSVSTQMVPYQRLHIFGCAGRLEIEVPYNAPPHAPGVFYQDDGAELGDASAHKIALEICDQYQLQAEQFGRYIRGMDEPEFPLEDSLAQMRIIDALFRSAESAQWVSLSE